MTTDKVVVVRVFLSHVRFLEITHSGLIVVSVVRKKAHKSIDRVLRNLALETFRDERARSSWSSCVCMPSATFLLSGHCHYVVAQYKLIELIAKWLRMHDLCASLE